MILFSIKLFVRNYLLVLLFFSVLAISILSPIASNKYLPSNELIIHTGSIVQAKMALDQGQFPIRIAPWQHQGWGNAWFQYYSPFPYTIAGAIYKWIVPKNPYLALKLMLWLSIVLGSTYFYFLIAWMIQSEAIALLSATVYTLSPYYILNIHARGDFTEAIAQMLVPIVLYYTLRLFFCCKFSLYYSILTAIAWCMLACTCIITYVYSSFFISILLLLIGIQNRPFLTRITYVGAAYLYGIMLAGYYIIPIILFEKYLKIDSLLNYFEQYNWLTSLPALFSIKALSPMPLPGNNLLTTANLYFSVGLPILLGTGTILYVLCNRFQQVNKNDSDWIISLLLVFSMAFIAVWTPFDFWMYLPKFLTVSQFSYRLLTVVMWSGAILFAFSLLYLFHNKFDARHAFVGLIIILISSASWIPNQAGSLEVRNIIANPSLGYGESHFLISNKVITVPIDASLKVFSVEDAGKNCTHKGRDTICNIIVASKNTLIQLPILYYPKQLHITANNKIIDYYPSPYDSYLLASLKLPPGHYTIQSYFQGIEWANWISILAWSLLGFSIVFSLFRWDGFFKIKYLKK